MPKYQYTLSSQSGIRTEGTLFAPNLEAAQNKLKRKNKFIISVIEVKKKYVWFWQRPGLSFQDKMMFVKHLGTMIGVGIPIAEALEIIMNQADKANNKRMYKNILDMVRSGQSLGKSLEEYGNIFSEVFINMISTGEKSGQLEETLKYLDLQLEKEYELRKKVISAFIYPAVILGVTLLIAIGIVIFIMPRIIKIFDRFQVTLPAITRGLISFSTFIIEKPLYTIAIILAVIAFLVTIFRVKILKPFWNRLAIYVPIFGKILIFANLARFSRTMNSLLASGIPVTKSLEITGKMIGNALYKQSINQAHEKVQQGAKLGESLSTNAKIFPPLATKMLEIGEKTGSLELTTANLAKLYEHNVENITKNLAVLLEPVLLVLMAVLVGGIAISIILPIYQLPSLLKQ